MKYQKKRAYLFTTLLVTAGYSGMGVAESDKLPVYHVERTGISVEQAVALSESLGVDSSLLNTSSIRESGALFFINLERHQFIPTKLLGKGKADEDDNLTTLEGIDFNGIASIEVVPENEANERFAKALKGSELFPKNAQAKISHSVFHAMDKSGNTLLKAQLDTRVQLDLRVGSYPIIGPGAKINATFGSEGDVTRINYVYRSLAEAEQVELISQHESKEQCAANLQSQSKDKSFDDLKLDMRLVYYAPPLNSPNVKTIIPFYDCGGTAVVGGNTIALLRELIPAVVNQNYVPKLSLQADARGFEVDAKVNIKGGTPPYRIDWSGSSKESGPSLSYHVEQRKGTESEPLIEVVMVSVTDANGVTVKARQAVELGEQLSFLERGWDVLNRSASQVLNVLVPPVHAVGGVRDYGTENAVTTQFGDLDQGFINRMQTDGVTERFSFPENLAWERDFKQSHDSSWIDNTDITFYVGHGYGGGFTFKDTTHDDSTLDQNDATEAWGNKDLEWLALLSCQVLKETWDGKSRFDRWKQEFDGLHLLLGFQTNAYAWSSFSGEFSDNMLKSDPMKVRQAWFEAVDTDQPNGVVAVVMGVISNNSDSSNMNDYFWGKGSVGPDIRDNDIVGYWTITGP